MKPGWLFWKFFFAFWLAQLLTGMAIGVLIHAFRHDRDHPPPPPPAYLERHDAGERPLLPPPPRSWLPPWQPLAAGSVVSLLFAWLLAGYFARPIRSLHDAFEAAAAGKLETRIGAAMGRRQDELADLGQDFDRMAERLQALVDGQRRLLHDVSHELRSPLARLQAATDLIRQQPERAQEFIERIERDTGRIDHLVGELLTLARLDAGLERPPHECFALAELLEDIGEDARFEAEAKGCRLALALGNELHVVGNVELLRRAFENVVRNAVRHAPVASDISVMTWYDRGQVTVRVQDAGTGVAPDDLSAIFEPFYRAGNTRSFEGYGLGLAITRQVMKLHGGTVRAENLAPTGFAVTLVLPCAAPCAESR